MRASRVKSMEETLRRARHCAAITVVASDTEFSVERHRQADCGTIAIIGPCSNGALHEEALLCEIGLGKSRPYREGWHIVDGVRRCIPPRYSAPFPIPRYELIGRELFLLMQTLVDERVSQWKTMGFYLPHSKNHLSRHQKAYLRSVQYKPVIRGVRFSVPIESQIAQDLAWAELFANSALTESLSGFARYIDLTLTHHYVHRKQWKGRTFFRDLTHVQECVDQIKKRRLKVRHLERLFELYPGGKTSPFLPHLKYLFGINGEYSPERMLANAATAGVQERVKGLTVEITRVEPRHGYLVVEIFPSPQLVATRLAQDAQNYADTFCEETPF